MELVIQPEATADLRRLHAAMRRHSPQYAQRWYEHVKADIALLAESAQTKHAVDGARILGRDVRRARVGRRGKTQLRAFIELQPGRVYLLRLQPSRATPIEMLNLHQPLA